MDLTEIMADEIGMKIDGRGLSSFTFQLNLSRFRNQTHPKHLLISPTPPKQLLSNPSCAPYPTESAHVELKSERV